MIFLPIVFKIHLWYIIKKINKQNIKFLISQILNLFKDGRRKIIRGISS